MKNDWVDFGDSTDEEVEAVTSKVAREKDKQAKAKEREAVNLRRSGIIVRNGDSAMQSLGHQTPLRKKP